MAATQADCKTRGKLLEFASSKPDTEEYYRWLQSLVVGDRVKLHGYFATRDYTVDQIRSGVIICDADVKFSRVTGYEANRAAAATNTRSSWVGKV